MADLHLSQLNQPARPLSVLLCPQRAPLLVDGSFQSLEALPVELLQIVFVASSSCSEDDAPASPPSTYLAAIQAGQPRLSVKKSSSSPIGQVNDVKAKARKSHVKTSPIKKVSTRNRERSKRMEAEEKAGAEDEVLDVPADGWPLRRVISIEEDHLPHLLQGGAQPFLHQLSEEGDEEEETQSDSAGVTIRVASRTTTPSRRESRHTRAKRTPASPRRQPIGRETQQVNSLVCFNLRQRLKD